jgi:hypothetical protein
MIDYNASRNRLKTFRDANEEVQSGGQMPEPKTSRVIGALCHDFSPRTAATKLNQSRSHWLTIVVTEDNTLELAPHNWLTVTIVNMTELETASPSFGRF